MSTPLLIADRLGWLEETSFESGSHNSIRDGCCVMEAVAYVAGEPHSDHPQCTCPIITAFMIGWNDNLPSNQDRDRLLKPLVPLIVGTRSNSEVEQRRGFLCVDWFIRTFVPAWLQLIPSLQIHAETLRKYPEITDVAALLAVKPVLADIAKSSAAARDAARDAWDALKPTVEKLQESATDLIHRMIAVK